jgi:hypothetical protein
VSEARTPEEESIPPAGTPPSHIEEPQGPTPEEEMRGAQPTNDDPDGAPFVEQEVRPSGKTADVVDLDEVNETGSGRSAHGSRDTQPAGES